MAKKFFHYGGNIAEGILAMFLYMILQIFYFTPQIVHKRFIPNINAQIIVTAVITVVILWFIFWMYKKQLQEVNNWGFNQEPHWSGKRVWISLVMFVALLFANVALMLILGAGRQTSTNQENLSILARGNAVMFKIMVVVIAPFCEELIFRGMFFNTFFTKPTKPNKWLGIIISGFLFAYMHDSTFSKFILVYWMMGMILAWTYLKTKDIRYSMITHMCNNLVATSSLVILLYFT